MGEMERIIEKAALLHDIGKVYLRAEPGHRTHSEAGVEFLLPYFTDDKRILRAVGHHHSKDLKQTSFSDDDISYLIYEADNIAASSDRRKNEDGGAGFSAKANLENIFNVFSSNEGKHTGFYLRGLLEDDEKMLYPLDKKDMQASSSEYKKITAYLHDNFQRKSPADMELNELLRIIEATMSYVPSSTAIGEIVDISLYDHQKLTAAFAVCMYQYFQNTGIQNYKEACYGSQQSLMRATPMYLLVSGDMSGIQDFIYTVPSKGALKSLRGRSFYLEILLEHMADEILTSLGLSRTCLLYTGGGHFYMLLPNIEPVQTFLQEFSRQMNEWFLQAYGNRLYIAMAWTPCKADEFKDGPDGGVRKVYQRVNRLLAKYKLCRYDAKQLETMFSKDSTYNHIEEGSRECNVCHMSIPVAELQQYSEENPEDLACQSCRNLLLLGKRVLQGDVFFVSAQADSDAMPLPGWGRELYLYAVRESELERTTVPIERIYVKNRMYTGKELATYLWMGDYTAQGEHHEILDFEELASLSGGSQEVTGIKRLGVMRADVDSLGAAFIAGFSTRYSTLSRTAALSRQLSLFFKRYINSICAGNINGINETQKRKFYLFNSHKKDQRDVHIVYSGGDDMFLVGAWDDLIELAVDIRQEFEQFTNGKLTFSAGIGFFHHACPISQMARVTGQLEDLAKGNPGKDSIMLFGTDSECVRPDVQDGVILKHSRPYSWDVFIHRVCGTKLQFLKDHFQILDVQSAGKLSLGKTGLYRILALLQEGEGDASHINLARFAYVLARLDPGKNDTRQNCYQEVRQQLYAWYMDDEDRRELATAIQLVVYNLREQRS
jgi:CRISPR-associated protein Csm1